MFKTRLWKKIVQTNATRGFGILAARPLSLIQSFIFIPKKHLGIFFI